MSNHPGSPGRRSFSTERPQSWETPQFLANQDTGPTQASYPSQSRDGHLSQNSGVHRPKWAPLPLPHHPFYTNDWTEGGHLSPWNARQL